MVEVAGSGGRRGALAAGAGRAGSRPLTAVGCGRRRWCVVEAAGVGRPPRARRAGRRRRAASPPSSGGGLGVGVEVASARLRSGRSSAASGSTDRRAGRARPRLVLRSVLARVGVLLRVERPVGARGRAVPRRAAPVRLERLRIGTVVRGRARASPCSGRAERGGGGPPDRHPPGPAAPDRVGPGRRRPGPAARARAAFRPARDVGRAAGAGGARRRRRCVARPDPTRASAAPGDYARRRPGGSPPPASDPPPSGAGGAPPRRPPRAVGQVARSGRRPRGWRGTAAGPPRPRLRVIGLGQTAVGALDLVERGAAAGRGPVRVGVGGHRRSVAESAAQRDQLADRRELELGDGRRADPAMRIQDGRRVVARQGSQRRRVEGTGLAQRLDRCGPRPAVVAVAVLDLDRHPRRGGVRSPSAAPGRIAIPRSASMPALLMSAALRRLHERRVEPVVAAADHLRVGQHRIADDGQRRRELAPTIAGGTAAGSASIAYAWATSRSRKA